MSEKTYAWLLKLFPRHFREAYGEDALQLFRDRLRDERGFLPALRLWRDLLVDLVVSLPREYRREYRYVEPDLIHASAQQPFGRAPLFHVLRNELPRVDKLLFGGILSVAVLATLSILLHRAGNLPPGAGLWFDARPINFNSLQAPAQAMPPDAARAVAANNKLDAAERQLVIHAAAANLRKHYFDRESAQKIASAIEGQENNGGYDAVTDSSVFADLLTSQMRAVSHDMHLVLVYSRDTLPQLGGPSPQQLASYKQEVLRQNCMFEKVEVLPQNIGYFKLDSFPDPSICGAKARAAMASLNRVDAVIFDLRDNRGGDPAMVALIAAYLFDHPEYWYNPRESVTKQSWTRSPVPGNMLANKPVFVLTSSRTISGAEQFTYDSKMLRRATIVGEKTAGSAHSGVFYRIDDHFGMGIPRVRTINPFSESDWEAIGVTPDVQVSAADALETAEKLAERNLRKK